MSAARLYLGLAADGARRVFRSSTPPTEATHGAQFAAVVGPFRTRRGAEFMRDHGAGNPHCRTVADAERLALRCAPLPFAQYRPGDVIRHAGRRWRVYAVSHTLRDLRAGTCDDGPAWVERLAIAAPTGCLGTPGFPSNA